jgi:hypothetical protein
MLLQQLVPLVPAEKKLGPGVLKVALELELGDESTDGMRHGYPQLLHVNVHFAWKQLLHASVETLRSQNLLIICE